MRCTGNRSRGPTLAAIRVAERSRGRAAVTLVDPKGALVERLRLHQVAAGQEIKDHALQKLAGRRVDVIVGGATAIDPAAGKVEIVGDGRARRRGFDRLIYALGSGTDMDSVRGVGLHAHSVSDRFSAQRLRDELARRVEGGCRRRRRRRPDRDRSRERDRRRPAGPPCPARDQRRIRRLAERARTELPPPELRAPRRRGARALARACGRAEGDGALRRSRRRLRSRRLVWRLRRAVAGGRQRPELRQLPLRARGYAGQNRERST
jgi:hypothetical protein